MAKVLHEETLRVIGKLKDVVHGCWSTIDGAGHEAHRGQLTGIKITFNEGIANNVQLMFKRSTTDIVNV